jgi:regulator of cell morphogenesis and NO signaling
LRPHRIRNPEVDRVTSSRDAPYRSTASGAAASFATRGLGRIAALLADAARVFHRGAPDSCCDAGAASADGAPVEGPSAIEAERPAPEETGALIRHILERYHEAHRREVPELIRLAGRVEAAHRDHPEAPLGLADLLSRVFSEMEQHLQKEEQGLFPMILDGHPDLAPAIAIMRDDHDDHSLRLRQIEAMTHDFTPPGNGCATWRALYAGTRKFADDLTAHIDLENSVLFPRFEG